MATATGARVAGLDGLVRRAQAGDRHAFDTLYELTAPRVFALCMRLCGDRLAAGALLQDTYVRAWQRLGAFRGESQFTSWLHRVAVNELLQERRARGRREAWLAAGENDLDRAAAPAVTPELGIDLERAIAQLPEGARTALVLHDVEGYTHREIAEMTGLAEGTIKAQLHRARRLLRGWLKA